MTEAEKTMPSEKEVQDAKQLKKFKISYPAAQFGGGIEKAYLSTYATYLYTNVYMMTAAFSGVLSLVQQIIGWIGGPLFGTILDRTEFKKGKYYPWLMIGPILYYGGWVLLYSLPAFGVSGGNSGMIALIIAAAISVVSPLATIPPSATFPLLSTNPKDRQFFARMQKFGRDGGKTVFGYIFPALLVAFTAASGEASAYAICALIATIPAVAGWFYYAMTLKGSYVEEKAKARSRAADGSKKKNIPLGLMVKEIFTNRPLLSMFLFMSVHKMYYFVYVTSAAYMWKYVFGDFSYMGTFMVTFNLTAIIGVMFGPLWKAIFKETKRCFVADMLVHVGILLIIALTFKGLSPVAFIALFAASSLFMGLLENYILPMFAASSDYGAWKSGNRLDGITMSIYSLTIKTGVLMATFIRTAVLVAANLDAVTAGGEITAPFLNTMGMLFSWIPFIGGVVATLILMFGFNLNDEKIALINQDLNAGKTKATSDLKI